MFNYAEQFFITGMKFEIETAIMHYNIEFYAFLRSHDFELD